ncbi:hypothetical protein E4F39_11265 [Burkholderia pseudomallei]|nr:hypothetical protein E4F39_11265 [Burkholderia pseudomallei]
MRGSPKQKPGSRAGFLFFCVLRSAFCVLRSAFCVLRSAFCVLRSAFRFPFSVFRFPFSVFRFPFSVSSDFDGAACRAVPSHVISLASHRPGARERHVFAYASRAGFSGQDPYRA